MKGLLKKIETEISVTEKGIQHLKEYRKVREFLAKFGMIKKEDKDQAN